MTQFSNPLFPSPADWRDLTFYQIFTDRFADGDTSNNESTPGARYEPAKPHGIHGGDFQGIEQHLDYIQGLGAKAIWITPVFLNESNSAWHGYGAINFDLISPQLGGLKALRDLIQSSHRRGIYVLIDVVANHTGDVITSDDPGWPSYRPTGEGYHLRWRDPKTIPPPPFNNLNCTIIAAASKIGMIPPRVSSASFSLFPIFAPSCRKSALPCSRFIKN